MGEDLECSETEYWHLLTVPLPDLVPIPLLSPDMKIEHWKPASVTDVEACL